MSCSFARWLCSLPAGALRMLFLFLFGAKGVRQFFDRVYKVYFIVHHTSVFATNLYLLDYLVIMASPGSLKGQRRGTCGHAMAAFDLHEKCARCREKKIGEDQCVKGLSCSSA